MCGFTLRNPNRIWPSIPVYEQSRARAPKRQAGCPDGRAPRKGRFDKKDPENINNDNNNSGNSNDNFKIKPSSVRMAAPRPATTDVLPGPRNGSGGTPMAPPYRQAMVTRTPTIPSQTTSMIPISMLPRFLSVSRPPPSRSRHHTGLVQPLLYLPRLPQPPPLSGTPAFAKPLAGRAMYNAPTTSVAPPPLQYE